MKVRPAQARNLRVHIRVDTASEQRVVRKINARHDMRRAEGHLLRLGKKVVWVAVEHHAANDLYRHQFLGDELGGVQDVKAELVGLLLAEDLHAQLPFWEGTSLDPFPQISAVEVRVGAGNFHGFVPHQRLRAVFGLPMELDERRLACLIHQAKGVHAKALHGGKAARYGAV